MSTTDISPPSPHDHFARDGFVFLRGFLDGDTLAELMERLNLFLNQTVPTLPREHVFYEDRSDPSTLKQIQRMFDHDPWFHRLMFGSRFERLAEELLDGPVTGKNLQYFNKPPGVGQPTPPHQDGFYFKLNPCEAVTMWLAIDVVDEENGCVRYVPGSHREGLLSHQRTETLGFSQGVPDYFDTPRHEIALPASPGDLLVHHALTLHRADGNRSAHRHRRALGFIYYSARAQEDTAAHEAYLAKLNQDLTASGRI